MTVSSNSINSSNSITTSTCERAFVTLVTSEPYVVGALVLGNSIRDLIQSGDILLVCMVTEAVSADSRRALASVFDRIVGVDTLQSRDPDNLKLLNRPDLVNTITKVNVWSLDWIKKAVFMDADMLVVGKDPKALTSLFERPELSACADIGWPDCFNSGLFVCEPNLATFRSILSHFHVHGSFDGTIIGCVLLLTH
mgnify:CR=1 FL=1